MLLYMIRHGESEQNLAGAHSGWSQTALSATGIEQAKRVGGKLKGLSFDRIFASDLIRAVQTCELALPGCAYETDPLLREINVGTLSGKTRAECLAEYGDVYLEAIKGMEFARLGGESQAMLKERVGAFLKKAETLQADRIAAFAHAGTLRAAAEIVLQAPMLKGRLLSENCCIAVFSCENGAWKLNAWNI